MNMYLKMAIACAVGALLALSLGKHVSDAAPALIVWGVIGAFAGFVLCGPKEFSQSIMMEWEGFQKRQKLLLKAEERWKREHHWLTKALVLRGHYVMWEGRCNGLAWIASIGVCISFLAIVLVDAVSWIEITVLLVYASGAAWVIMQHVQHIPFERDSRFTKSSLSAVEGEGWPWDPPFLLSSQRKERIRDLCCEIRSRKSTCKRMLLAPFAVFFFAWWTVRHVSELVMVAGIILARICRRVVTFERWCSAIGAVAGYVAGLSFGRSGISAMLVGAGVGVSLRFAAKHLLPLLPDPDLCLFDTLQKSQV